MNADDFQAMAEAAYATLPVRFTQAIENVVILTEDSPDAATLGQMQADSPCDLLGLYHGWPLPERGTAYSGHPPDIIHLYRKPIMAYCAQHGEDMAHCIRHVLIHEIGHYFGFSDEEMEGIESPAR